MKILLFVVAFLVVGTGTVFAEPVTTQVASEKKIAHRR